MSKDPLVTAEAINNYHAGGSRRAAELAKAIPPVRPNDARTARARIAAAKPKKGRIAPLGPTPERMAKGDTVRTGGGFHRSIPVIERLRDQRKLDDDRRTSEAMYQAAEKLRRHFEGFGGSVQAQDLNKVMGSAGSDDLTQEEAWVHHRVSFRTAVKLIGWSETNVHRGAARIVVAVVCYELSIREAAAAHLRSARIDAMQVTAMDRLREGLFALAVHWRML